MKRDDNKNQKQNIQTEQKSAPVIRVQSGLRAGAVSVLRNCGDI